MNGLRDYCYNTIFICSNVYLDLFTSLKGGECMDIKGILALLGFYFPLIVACGFWIAKKDGVRK